MQKIHLFITTFVIATLTAASAPAASSADSASARTPHNPAFLRKLANPAAYTPVVNFDVSESICGTSNLQHVNEYDGSRGQPVEFVAKYEPSVAAMARLTPPKDGIQSAPLTRKYCSGTLIAPDLFLTASHCLGSTVTNDYVVFNYQKLRGSADLAEPDHRKILAVVEDGGRLDYAILKVEGNPGHLYGYKHVRLNPVENNHLITIIQHPKGNPKMVDVGHKLREQNEYMRYGNLDTEPGSSGSGVLDQNGDVIGVHTLGGCYATGGSNAGVLMTHIARVSQVIRDLAEPPPAPVQPPPQPEPPAPQPQPPTQPPTPQPPSQPPVVEPPTTPPTQPPVVEPPNDPPAPQPPKDEPPIDDPVTPDDPSTPPTVPDPMDSFDPGI